MECLARYVLYVRASCGRWIVALVLTAGCHHWSRRDTIAELGFASATTLDWAQTRGITQQCLEENPLLGACGENLAVGVYFPSMMLVHLAVAAVLPPRWRLAWQALAIGAEVNQVWRNQANGYGLTPPPEVIVRQR